MNISERKPYFGVDRRPVCIFTPTSLGCSMTGMKALGWDDRYYNADGLTDFIEQFIFSVSKKGARRFICMYPAGAAPDSGSSNIYQPLSLPSVKITHGGISCVRDNPFMVWSNPISTWRMKIEEWKSEFGKSSQFVVGMSLASPAGGYSDYATIGSLGNNIGISQSNLQFLSWLNYNASNWKSLGADGIAFSNVNQAVYYASKSSPAIQNYLYKNLSMRSFGIGLPCDTSEYRNRLSDLAYVSSPYILRSIDGNNGLSALGGSWDPDRTEIHITMPPSQVDEFTVSSYFDRGIIVGVEFDPENVYAYSTAVEMVNDVYRQLESKRLAKSSRNMTVFSMAAGDARDSYGQPDSRFASFNSSKANINDNILPVIRINCSSSKMPLDPDRFFVPNWWWSNNKSQCPDQSMMESISSSWLESPFDRKMLLTNTPSPYGTTGPEKCADIYFDLLIQYISKYGSLLSKPWSSSFDAVVALENWGGGKYCSDDQSSGLENGECRLFGHVEDRLEGVSPNAPLYDLSSLYIENGINECAEWLDRFASRISTRRNSYANSSVSNTPPTPSKIIFNNMAVPDVSYFMLEPVKKNDASSMIGKDIKRNVDTFYGSLDAVFSDKRYTSFVFDNTTLEKEYNLFVSNGEFDVDASLPDSAGSIGSYTISDARYDKDYLFYQPNAPARKWLSFTISKISSYGISKAFEKSIYNHFPGCKWAIPNITISNPGNENIYNIGSKICSDVVSQKGTSMSHGGISSPRELRMHISRLAMPSIHNQQIPINSNIVCFDICGSKSIKDGTFLPIWGASHNRPLVGVSKTISQQTSISSISLEEDRSYWYDVPGSIFSNKDAYSQVQIKSSKPLKYNAYGNSVSEINKSAAMANEEANSHILDYLISSISGSNIIFMPFIMGTAVSDSSWTEEFDIGNARTGTLSGSKNIPKYKVGKSYLYNIVSNLYSKGCNSIVHMPCAHMVGDWNNMYEVVSEINSNTVESVQSQINSNLSSVSIKSPPEVIDSNYSYALSIAYDYSFASSTLQTTSRPHLVINKELFDKGTLAISLVSSDSKSQFNFSSILMGDLKAIDVVNLLNRQEGIISKVINGNANIPAKDLIISEGRAGRSGWIFLALSSNSKSNKVASEARSRPFDYLKLKNTSISPQISQYNPSMSFGGFPTDADAYKSVIISSPIYVSSNVINAQHEEEISPSYASINGEIIKVKSMGSDRIEIIDRALFGTRRKMHLPGDQIIFSDVNIFDSRFGSQDGKFEQYRCFSMKNTGDKVNIHNISLIGVSSSSASRIEIAIEWPSLNSGLFQVASSGKNFIQLPILSDLNDQEKNTLIGTSAGIPLPKNNYAYREIENIEKDIAFVSRSFPYPPSTGTYVKMLGSKAGYSGGGLFYPTSSGNYISDFYEIMSGDVLKLDEIYKEEKTILAPGQFVYLWIKRRIMAGAKSVDGGNFMPKIEFEVS